MATATATASRRRATLIAVGERRRSVASVSCAHGSAGFPPSPRPSASASREATISCYG